MIKRFAFNDKVNNIGHSKLKLNMVGTAVDGEQYKILAIEANEPKYNNEGLIIEAGLECRELSTERCCECCEKSGGGINLYIEHDSITDYQLGAVYLHPSCIESYEELCDSCIGEKLL